MFEVDTVVSYGGSKITVLAEGVIIYPTAAGIATAQSGSGRKALWVPGDGQREVSCVAVNPRGTMLCVAETRLKVSILTFSLPDRRPMQRVPDAARGGILDMTFSRDGQQLAALSAAPLHAVSIYAVDAGYRLTLLFASRQPASHSFTSVSFSPRNFSQLCTVGGGHVSFWRFDKAAGTCVATPGRTTEASSKVSCHAWLPSGDVACGTFSGEVQLFDAATAVGGLVVAFGNKVPVTSMALNKHCIVAAQEDGSLRMLTPDAQQVVRTIFLPMTQLQHIAFAPEWHSIVAGGRDGSIASVHIVGLDNPNLTLEEVVAAPHRVTKLCNTGESSIGSRILHRAENVLASIVNSSSLVLTDTDSNKELSFLSLGPDICSFEVGVESTAHMAVATSLSGMLRVITLRDLNAPRIAFRGKVAAQPVHCALVTPGGQRAVLRTGTSGVIVFDLQALRLVASFTIPDGFDGIQDLCCFPRSASHLLIATGNASLVLIKLPSELPPSEVAAPPHLSFDDVFVNAWRLELPLFRVLVAAEFAEQLNVIGQSFDRETKFFVIDRTLPSDRKDKETKAVRCTMPFKDHEKRGTHLSLINRSQLLSCAADGRLVVRDIAPLQTQTIVIRDVKKEPLFVVTKHASLHGGIHSVSVHPSGQSVVTNGADGCCLLWAASGTHRTIPQLTTIAKSEAIEKDDDQLYWDKRRAEHELSERLAHAEARAETLKKVLALRDQAVQLRKENEVAEEDEKLPTEALLVSRERQRFEKDVSDTIEKVKDEVRWADLKNDYIADKLKTESWDVMDVKLTPLVALNTPGLVVHNFHLRTREKKDLELLQKLKFLRRVEELDRRARGVHELESVVEVDENAVPAPSIADLPVKEVKATPEAESAEDVTPYLYPRMLVFTRQRAIMQAFLLQFKAHNFKTAFNSKFNELVATKKSEIGKIDERNARCKQVQKELEDTTPLFTAAMHASEKPELLFVVADAEVPADIGTNPEERKRRAAEEAERERWRRIHGTDDSSERALKAWMDGRLEKEERLLDIKVDKPEFADEASPKYVTPDERSEEQNKAFKDYQTRLQKRIDEVNKRKKELSTELAELQKANIDAANKFDQALQGLLMSRLVTAQKCYEVELQQTKLAEGIVTQQSRQMVLSALEKQRQHLAEKFIAISAQTSKFSAVLDEKRKELNAVASEERGYEKATAVKSHPAFAESEHAERLSKLFINAKRKQPKRAAPTKGAPAAAKARPVEVVAVSADPYAFIDREDDAKKRQIAEELASITLPRIDQPEGISDDLWHDFQQFVDDRVEAERRIKKLHDELHDDSKEDAALKEAEEKARQLAADATEEVHRHAAASVRSLYDIDDLYLLRQGQVEVEQAPVVTDYGDAVLCNSSRVLELNAEIRNRGQGKVALLRDLFDKRQDNRFIEWENLDIELRTEIVKMNFKHLHTLRVTKQMQEFINGGGEDHNEKQRQKLMRKIDHVQQSMAAKIEDRRQQMAKIKRQIREQEMENSLLHEQVGDSQALVDTRRSIHQLQSSELERERNDKLMRDMRVTRKLEDVARAQQAEMIELKKEIERLRERTFPSFAVVSKRVIGNPDEA